MGTESPCVGRKLHSPYAEKCLRGAEANVQSGQEASRARKRGGLVGSKPKRPGRGLPVAKVMTIEPKMIINIVDKNTFNL